MENEFFSIPRSRWTGKKYWRSLGQLSDTPEFRGWLEREFSRKAHRGIERVGTFPRRNSSSSSWAASTALSPGWASKAPAVVPRNIWRPSTRGARSGRSPVQAPCLCDRPSVAFRLRTGRGDDPRWSAGPSMEGNPLHPVSKGATDLHTQSSLLDLYSPDRVHAIAFVQWQDGDLRRVRNGAR